MNILVTGAKGFLGRNLVAELRNRGYREVREFDLDSPGERLEEYAREAEFVFHLAGVNRPDQEREFMEGNRDFTRRLLCLLGRHGRRAPVVFSSSAQAARDNPYGLSKRAAEGLVAAYGREHGAPVYIYRLTNLFGKWSRPDYNSVVATFCHNIARGQEIRVNDPGAELELCYLDDVLEEFGRALEGAPTRRGEYCAVPVSHRVLLGDLAERVRGFAAGRADLGVPDLADAFTRKLYATYTSFLPGDGFSYPLEAKSDERGWFAEFLRTPDRGQVAVNISRPGVVKGNHWHHTKVEKFLVVRGRAVIRFRPVGGEKVTEYRVDGEKPEVVDIPAGYTHNIENTGEGDLVTVIWASEPFDPGRPDTYREEV